MPGARLKRVGNMTALSIAAPFYAPAAPAQVAEPLPVSWEIAATGADAARRAGFRGKGIAIGVLDNGFLVRHPLLSGPNFHPLDSTLNIDGNTLIFDARVVQREERGYATHGASVSAAIAGQAYPDLGYLGGMAPEADLYLSSMTPSSVTFATAQGIRSPGNSNDNSLFQPLDQQILSHGLHTLYRNVPALRVINNSWNDDAAGDHPAEVDAAYQHARQPGMPASPLLDSFRTATRQDVLLVFAAGNEGKAQPGLMAALPRYLPELESRFLSVVALDAEGQLAAYSNQCGVSKAWCLSAPGDIYAASASDAPAGAGPAYNLVRVKGTSIAAPLVSGAAGLIRERFPYMTMAQVRNVMLSTATPDGAERISEAQGWGRLDVARALQGPEQLLGDPVYHLDRASYPEGDVWRNDIVAGGRLGKAGNGTLSLAGMQNRFAGVTVHDGLLTLEQAHVFSQPSRVDGGELRVDGSLDGPALHVASAGTLSGSGDIRAPTRIDGSLASQQASRALTFHHSLILGRHSRTRLAAAPLVLSGSRAQAMLGGTLIPSGLTAGSRSLLRTTAGARYHGRFDRLQQDPALKAAGQRHDLLFAPDGIRLAVHPQALPGQQALTANAARGATLLNQLRDHPQALGDSRYNRWLHQALAGHAGSLPQTIGGQIHADLGAALLLQPLRLQSALQTQLGRPGQVPGGKRWWLDAVSERAHSSARPGIAASKEHSSTLRLGLGLPVSERLAFSGGFSPGKDTVSAASAHARTDLLQLGVAARYGLRSLDHGPYIGGQLAVSRASSTITRNLAPLGQARGDTGGWLYGAGLTGGYRWQVAPDSMITPHAGLQGSRGHLRAFREHGGELPLSVERSTLSTQTALAGIDLERRWQRGRWTLLPGLSIAYQRTLGRSSQHSQARIDGFTVGQTSARHGRDRVAASLKLDARYADWTARVRLAGLTGSGDCGGAASLQLFRAF